MTTNMRILPSRYAPALCLVLTLIVFLNTPAAQATDWRTPAEQLAERIAAVTGPGTVALDVVNRSFLGRTDTEAIRRGLLTQLANLGIHFVSADQASATVRVFLSEDLQNYILVAEIRQGANESSAVMVSAQRSGAVATDHAPVALTINKSLLWTQEGRILDVALVSDTPPRMFVLDASGVKLYGIQGSHWQQEQALAISHSRPWPRDLRGRLVLRSDHLVDAYLPGALCRSTTGAPLALNCSSSDDPWPLGTGEFNLNAFFAPTRNFFTGALSPGIGKQTATPAFYSAAALPREKYTLWLFTAVDGHVDLLDGTSAQVVQKLGWGSDIASVRSGCGSGWQILATGSGEDANDTVRAFEIPDREALAVGQPLDLGGSITALWAGPDGSSAIAVSQNSKTRKYEAYRITITCGQ